MSINLWTEAEHALAYLAKADTIPRRTEGEATLLELVPKQAQRLLDLGTGDGRLLALLKIQRPQAQAVALDFSPTMLAAARSRFAQDEAVQVLEHSLDQPLPEIGQAPFEKPFDAIVSSFAIHHCSHERKRSLYGEIWTRLAPGGIFCNLEHVASPTPRIHHQFLDQLGIHPDQEDPSNQLLDVETQLEWLRQIGFSDVDCFWKWRELALLVGSKPIGR
jgi:tRNA (cmo5U34)-methyltransferase